MRTRFGVLGVLVAFAAVACGSGSSGGADSSTVVSPAAGSGSGTIAGVPANNHGEKEVTGQSSVTIQANDYYFSPSILHGSAGQKVTLHITNASGTEHNFSVDSEKISSTINPKGSITASVTFPASGVLSFYCAFHRSMGMAGGLLTSGDPASGGSAPAPSSTASSNPYGY